MQGSKQTRRKASRQAGKVEDMRKARHTKHNSSRDLGGKEGRWKEGKQARKHQDASRQAGRKTGRQRQARNVCKSVPGLYRWGETDAGEAGSN
ncbi:hypothetical protein Pcinc_021234 [Petrolisthes cinctipes]|uniref:Uncharacterized protein n=1 Tax=Petrolisthes cinctipes TaxID=88211 RepID=A0AAE1FGC9_PETCI|nr:hypothetical protein Pcinc_021234 [Petrolisthes cinctipes]